jgi:putative membrane protein
MHAGLTSSGWATEPALIAPVAIVGVAYAAGSLRMRTRHRQPILWFTIGWIVLALALLSPLHELSERLFAAHMAQHELLMVVAAPLLILGRPSIALLWSLPRRLRGGVGRVMRLRIRPLEAWLVHAIVIWLWHVPALFESTLRSDVMHGLQHASFLGSALVFWSAIMRPRRRASLGLSIIYLFTTAVHTSVLGALMTFARAPWYAAYASTAVAAGFSPAEDQQLAGLIMWIPASAAYLIAAVIVIRRWLADSEWAGRAQPATVGS